MIIAAAMVYDVHTIQLHEATATSCAEQPPRKHRLEAYMRCREEPDAGTRADRTAHHLVPAGGDCTALVPSSRYMLM